MDRLIEALLTTTQGDERLQLQWEQFDLLTVVKPAIEVIRPTLSGDVSLDLEGDEAVGLAWADRDAIRRLLDILLENAVKHTSHGSITVTVRWVDTGCQIVVSDTGAGIAPKHLPFLFDRFYRANPSRSGSGFGLGLAIAKQIVDAHQGRISVESVEEERTTVTVMLPNWERIPLSPSPLESPVQTPIM